MDIVLLLIASIVVIIVVNTMSYLVVKHEAIKAQVNLDKMITTNFMIKHILESNISPFFKSDPYYFKNFTSQTKLDQFKDSIKKDKYFEVYFSNPIKYKDQCNDVIDKYLNRYALLVSEYIQLEYMINTISKITDIPFATLVEDMSLTSSDGAHIDPPSLIYSHFSKEAIDKIIAKYENELKNIKIKNITHEK